MTNYLMERGSPRSNVKPGPKRKRSPMFDQRRKQLFVLPNEWFIWTTTQKHRGTNAILAGLENVPMSTNVKHNESSFKIAVRANGDNETFTVYVKYVPQIKEKK